MYDFVLSDLQTYAKLHQGNVGIIERTLVSERKKRFGYCEHNNISTRFSHILSSALTFFHTSQPDHQRYIIRLCLMSPIYALISWLSYRFYYESTYYITIRDCYEAFVLASFFILLLQYLGDSPEEQRRQLVNTKKQSLIMPLCCLRYNPTKQHWLFWTKWGILQYVIVKPIVTIVAVVLE